MVGAGLGGLSAAAHLLERGFDVTVLERSAVPGGLAGRARIGDFSFDTGPTVLTMPELLERVFAAAGQRLEDFVTLKPLDPLYRAVYADGSSIHVRADRDAMVEEIRAVAGPADAASFDKFCRWLKQLYDTEMPHFIDRNFDSVFDLARPPTPALRLFQLGAFRKLAPMVKRFFDDERLQRLFSFQSLYAGVAPHEALAVYAVIAYMDTVRGVFFPEGGIHAVATGLADALTKAGASLRYECTVERIVRDGTGSVSGVQLTSGEVISTRSVVCNADMTGVYRHLLGDSDSDSDNKNGGGDSDIGVPVPKKLRRGTYSPSAVVWHAGVRGVPDKSVAHHNIHFGRAWEPSFDSLVHDGERMADPSLLISVPTVSDATLAPPGRSVLYVLEPVPNLDGHVDWSSERSLVRDQLAQRVAALGYPHVVEEELLFDPLDWQAQGLERGTPFSLAHSFLQSGPFRPSNLERRVPGLFFVGAATNPGVGVPMVLISGRLAAERVATATATANPTGPRR